MVRQLLLFLSVMGTMVTVEATANAETVERVRCGNLGRRTVTIHRKPGVAGCHWAAGAAARFTRPSVGRGSNPEKSPRGFIVFKEKAPR
jgi:hypothetical protein